jgi:electron transport complex protein RnfD
MMRDVLVALAPAAILGCIYFGWNAVAILIVSTFTAVATEYVINQIQHKPTTIGDASAAVTGLLIGLNIPAGAPLFLAIIGPIFAITIVKMFFGGLGYNMFNPALVGRAVLLVSYPQFMTAFVEPFTRDAVTSATPLQAFKAAGTVAPLARMFFGDYAGVIGETSALALLIGGIYLIYRKTIDWRIPVSYIVTVGVFTQLFGGSSFGAGNGLFQIMAGGLFLGAIYMATDPVTSPVTPRGRIVAGILAGVLTSVFRIYGKSAEGVTYAILLTNALTPLIDKYTAPRRFGVSRRSAKQGV